MTEDDGSGGDRAESMVAVGQLEQVLDSRVKARAEADARVKDAELEAERTLGEARERGRAAADAVRRSALAAAEHYAAELTRQTEAEVATLHARAAEQRPEAVRAILAALLPGQP
jgi:vacuolar-type H+-ATPase subunit H